MKPKPYHLEQRPTSDGYNQCSLDLVACRDEEGRIIIINTNHDIFLKPRSARAVAKRLLEMATWVEAKP